jgi:hypothetical protein
MRVASLAIIIVPLLTTGCISETTVYHSADGKQTGVCSGAGFGFIRGTLAISQYHNCQEAYLAAGYVEGAAPK